MAFFLRVPRLYPEMEEATVGRWIAREGEPLAPHTPVVEIITDKVSYEVEVPESDAAAEIALLAACAPEKSVLPVESILAVLGKPGEDASNAGDWRTENEALAAAHAASLGRSPAAGATPGPTASSGPAAASPRPAAAAGPAGIIRATPAARRAAKAAGVTLEEVAASAAGGTVTEADVEKYLEQKKAG